MELIIRAVVLFVLLCGVAAAQETVKAQEPVKAQESCTNSIEVQTVLLTLEESDLNSMYVKWFNSGVPLDNGTGIRQERAIVPGGATSKGLITMSFTASAKGETQIRRKSWLGLRDQVLVAVRNGVIVFTDEELVKGIPRISEVQTKCF